MRIGSLSKTDKIKSITFVAVAYGLPWLFFPWIPAGEYDDVFGIYMMILPTVGIVFGRSICKRKICGWFHWLYAITFVGYTAVMLLWVTKIISGGGAYDMLLLFNILSICLLLGSIIDEREFYPFRSFKKSIVIYLVFIGITQIANLSTIMHVEAGNVLVEILSGLTITPISLLISESIYLFGEEYAWRGCLQERLQNLLGKRMGVIILGIVWELWHMPLWFTTYELNREKWFVLIVLVRMLHSVGMAVFLGWAYMKTQNIWLCVLLHGVNNSAALFGYSYGQLEDIVAIEVTDPFYLIAVCLSAIIMFLFLFTKEYRKEKEVQEDSHVEGIKENC